MLRISKPEVLSLVAAEAGEIEARFGGCAMCATVAGSRPRAVLASSDAAIATLDRFAARPGHVVVVLRRHAERLTDLSWMEHAAVQRLAWEAAQALERALSPRRTYMAALGAAQPIATSFPHHHVHVIPLANGGEEDRPAAVLTWSNGVYVYEDGEAESLAAKLRAAWPAAG